MAKKCKKRKKKMLNFINEHKNIKQRKIFIYITTVAKM